ncbi:MAG: hypothetical protein HC854_03620 [Flavobacterium sp.]|nr:hypothetical protein [Flavobacterium sp.]
MLQIFDKIIRDANRPETEFNLVASQFKGNKNLRIFKAIYKINTPKIDINFYKYIYFISYNKKTVLVNLETPVLFDFDPYVEKIRL